MKKEITDLDKTIKVLEMLNYEKKDIKKTAIKLVELSQDLAKFTPDSFDVVISTLNKVY